MDFGALGWLRIKSTISLSNPRDQYIIKKYTNKQWVSSSKAPNIPPSKSYCDQEIRVIEYVSSAKFGLEFCADQMRHPRDHRIKPLMVLKRREKQSVEISGSRLNGPANVAGSCIFGESDMERNHCVSKTTPGRQWLSCGAAVDSRIVEGALIGNIDAYLRPSFDSKTIGSQTKPTTKPLTTISHLACIQDSLQQTFNPWVDTEDRISDSDIIITVCDVGVQTE